MGFRGFLGFPAGFPTFPALFEGLCSCGGVSVDRTSLYSRREWDGRVHVCVPHRQLNLLGLVATVAQAPRVHRVAEAITYFRLLTSASGPWATLPGSVLVPLLAGKLV